MADIDSTEIAEKVFDKITKKDDVKSISKDRIYFHSDSENLTDDSGYIPLDKQLNQLTTSGAIREMYLRMMNPNNSQQIVENDFRKFKASDRLQLLQKIRNEEIRLHSVIESSKSKASGVTTPPATPPQAERSDNPPDTTNS